MGLASRTPRGGACLADTMDPINLSFSKIAGNTQADQVNVNLKISQVDSDTLLLEFTNQSPLESVVSEIYFQDKDGVVKKVKLRNKENVGKVIFRDGVKPSDLPGGNPYNFSTAFAVEAKNPSPKYGINPNETLKVYLDLNDSAALNSLLARRARVAKAPKSRAGLLTDLAKMGAVGERQASAAGWLCGPCIAGPARPTRQAHVYPPKGY